MAKARSLRPFFASARGALLLAVSAAALFVGGELFLLARSDAGLVSLAKHLNLVGRPRVTQILSAAMKRGLRSVGVPPTSIAESFPASAPAPLRWDVAVPPEASLVLTNYALSQALQGRGARVFGGREERLADGGARLILLVGITRYVTHQVVLTRPPAPPPGEKQSRMAVVLFGFSADDAGAPAALDARAPFAVAVLPGSRHFSALLERARRSQREVVLSLPMEPLNYPRIDPGPGAVLVSMKPLEVRRVVKRHLEAAGPVVAVSNFMGSFATQDVRVMRVIYEELRSAHLPFLHVDPVPGEVCKQLSSDLGVSYQTATAALDREARTTDLKRLEKSWKEVLSLARERGRAVVFVRATPGVRAWLPRLADPARHPGVDLVPLSELVPRPPAL